MDLALPQRDVAERLGVDAASGGSCTVTVTTLTATGASGTLSFSAAAAGTPATGTKIVTNGVSNVTF